MFHVMVEKNDLLKLLTKAQSITYKKSTMVVLNNILLYTDKNNLFIERTDLEISYKGKTECEVIEQDSITIPAKKIYELIKEFPNTKIEIKEIENERISITSEDKTKYIIAGYRVPDFPKFPIVDTSNSFKVKANKLKALFDKVLFSVSSDETKYSLSALLVDKITDENKISIRTVGSDGHRLSYYQIDIDDNFEINDNDILIPKKIANEIRKFIDTSNDSITFGIFNDLGFVISENEEMVFRLMDGNYPDYKRIISYKKDRFFDINRSDFYEILKRISILTPDVLTRGVISKIDSDRIQVELINKEFGEAKEIMNIKYDGDGFTFAFNAKYMMDVLNVMQSDEVTIVVNEGLTPCIIEGKDDPGFLGLIMPMTLNENN